MTKTVIVTGGSGYIGGQTMLALRDQRMSVIGIDIRPLPQHLKSVPDRFYQEDFASEHGLSRILEHRPIAVIHCAGTSLVGPSISDPESYYRNNFVKTKGLADYVLRYAPKTRIVFSSSAAVYGEPVITPCQESDPPLPVSPYGESKLMTEMMLSAYHRAYALDYVAFRYFNACGADSQGRHGQEPGATHIIARVLESLRDDREFTLYGSDYATADGTCVRDYVHVEDIAQAHHMAVYDAVPSGVYNLGTSVGASNREIMTTAESVTDRDLRYVMGTKRSGDPAVLTAASQRFNLVTGWVPRYNLHEIIQHAWAWYQHQRR
jgi:UDP-glucose 4-epimerase